MKPVKKTHSLTIAVALLAAPCAGQATSPATTPATAPAIDPQSPLGVVRTWLSAMDGDGPDAVPEVLLAETDAERSIAAALADLAQSSAKLRAATLRAFGINAGRVVPDGANRLLGATEVIQGDRATVKLPSVGQTLQLRNVGGRWRIPVAQALGPQARDAEATVAKLRVLAESIASVAQDVVNDRFHSADEVAQAMQEEVTRAAVRQNRSRTTVPATTRKAVPTTAP